MYLLSDNECHSPFISSIFSFFFYRYARNIYDLHSQRLYIFSLDGNVF